MKNLVIMFVAALSMLIFSENSFAQKNGTKQGKYRKPTKTQPYKQQTPQKSNAYDKGNKTIKKTNTSKTTIYHHPQNVHKQVYVHTYPRNRVVVVKPRAVKTYTMLPVGYTTVYWAKRNYYFHTGRFYHWHKGAYMIVPPPFGIRIKVLPAGFRTIYIGAVPRYYYAGVYYKQVDNEYETIEPEEGMLVPELPEDAEEVTIDGATYYTYDDIVYKSKVTTEGMQYEVAGKLDE